MSTKKSTEIKGQATAEQIQDWKSKHDDVFAYEADGRVCYLKRPSRTIVSAASVTGQNDPFKFTEVILVNCWLGGSEDLRTEDKYFMGLSQKVSEIVEIKVGKIKKL